jgi:hypothetical protein
MRRGEDVELDLQLVTNRFKCSAGRSAFWRPVSHLLGLLAQLDVFVATDLGLEHDHGLRTRLP